MQSKIDFSFLGAGLGMSLLILILWSFTSIIFGLHPGYIYSLLGSLIFCGYIVYDTWLLTRRLAPDEYILAAISLYLDIINLFLFLVQLLSRFDPRNRR